MKNGLLSTQHKVRSVNVSNVFTRTIASKLSTRSVINTSTNVCTTELKLSQKKLKTLKDFKNRTNVTGGDGVSSEAELKLNTGVESPNYPLFFKFLLIIRE